jgi:hypothetical protein
LATKVTGGVRTYANNQMNSMTQQARDMASSRTNQMKGMAMQRVDQARMNMTPILERIGATPLIPSFVYRLLRGEVSLPKELDKKMASSTEKTSGASKQTTTTTTTVPTTTVKIDIVGTKPFEANKVSESSKTASFGGMAASLDLKEMKPSSAPIGNTNAQGLGELGSAGMGVTTTGNEDKSSEDVEEQGEHKGKKKKHHKM